MNIIKLVIQAFFKKINKNYYSQFGEDRIIINEILNPNYRNGFYIDVGCFHPKKYSNTYLLHKKKNWNGINIDIEVDKIKVFNIARPGDLNICCPISDKKSKVKVVKRLKYAVNSFIRKGKKREENLIQTKTLNEIIEKTKYKKREVDLLNIDTEGHDFKVLKSINLKKYKPKIIIIEAHEKEIKNILKSKIYKYLSKYKYNLRSWSFYSLIFVLKNSKITRNR